MTSTTWNLIWQDEFDGIEIDHSKWCFEVGYTGKSNGELQIYTDRRENAYLERSNLIIKAQEETYQGYRFTSARLKTQGLHNWKYGRFEGRIKIPYGTGLWPAFWMIGDDAPSIGWPDCGEIDIMENIGAQPNSVRGTIHGPGYFRDDGIWADFTLSNHVFADDYHLFAVEWEPAEIRWYVDSNHYNTLTAKDVPGKWVFDHPFYLLINVAVGGHWPGYPDETTRFPQVMHVDYVRVYSK